MNNSRAAPVYVPHSIEAEQALLGAILVNPEAFDRAEPYVSSADFFEPIHAHLFERFAAARKDGSAITIHLAVAWLEIVTRTLKLGDQHFVVSQTELFRPRRGGLRRLHIRVDVQKANVRQVLGTAILIVHLAANVLEGVSPGLAQADDHCGLQDAIGQL